MTEYEMLKHINAARTTKSGNPDKRYKLTKQLEANYSGGLHIVNQTKRKETQAIAESSKRKRVQKIKKPSFRERVARFFETILVFIFLVAPAIGLLLQEIR